MKYISMSNRRIAFVLGFIKADLSVCFSNSRSEGELEDWHN